jgi:integration host factor subunit alpha
MKTEDGTEDEIEIEDEIEDGDEDETEDGLEDGIEEESAKTFTRSDLASAITNEFWVTKFTALEIVEDVLDEISTALIAGESVKIAGFGTFTVRQKNARIGRNPRTLEKAIISPRKSISFKASAILKKSVNGEI